MGNKETTKLAFTKMDQEKLYLQSNQVKSTPLEYINEMII